MENKLKMFLLFILYHSDDLTFLSSKSEKRSGKRVQLLHYILWTNQIYNFARDTQTGKSKSPKTASYRPITLFTNTVQPTLRTMDRTFGLSRFVPSDGVPSVSVLATQPVGGVPTVAYPFPGRSKQTRATRSLVAASRYSLPPLTNAITRVYKINTPSSPLSSVLL